MSGIDGQWGKPAKDGKFEFTVTDMRCGVKQVGDNVLGAKAQGDLPGQREGQEHCQDG